VGEAAAPLLRIVAFGMPALALTTILSGGLRGAGDTRWTLIITFAGLVGVRIPVAYLLAHGCGLGIRGAWYAMVADLTVRCILVGLRFRHGGWKRIEV
jgi:Na+-driven multidrug efflux pump